MTEIADILAGVPLQTDPLSIDRREPIRVGAPGVATGWSPVDLLAVRAGMLGQQGDPSGVVDYSNLSNIDIGQLLATQAGGRAPEPDDPPATAGFLKSLISGATAEALGLKPLEGVDEYRAQHPYAGATSELLGLVPGYVAGVGAASTALRAVPRLGPKFAAVVAGLGKSAAESGVAANVASGFARGALREAVQILPFEAARIGMATTFEDKEWAQNTAAQAAVNLGLSAAIGGAFRWFKESRPGRAVMRRGEEQLGQLMSKWNLSDPTQDKIARLRVFKETETFQGLPDADKNTIEDALFNFEREIETEWPAFGTRGGQEYSQQLGRYVPTGNPVSKLRYARADNRVVGELFRRKQGEAARSGDFTTYKLEDIRGGKYQDASEEVTSALLERAGLPTGWQAVSQYPTFVKPRNAQKVAKTIRDNFMPAGNHWFMNRELGEDGLWVMARKIRGGAAPSDSDWWMVLKTNNPRALHPAGDQSLGAFERAAFAMQEQPRVHGQELSGRVEDPAQPGTMLPGAGIGLARDMKPIFDIMLSPDAALTSGEVAATARNLLQTVLPKELVDDIASGIQTTKIYAKRLLAPSTARTSSLAERRAMQTAQISFSYAHKRVVDKTAGRLPRGARQPVSGALTSQMRVEREGGAWGLVEEMARRNTEARPTLAQFTAAIDSDMLPIEAARRGYDRSVIRTLEKLREFRLDTDREFVLAGTVYDIAGQEPRFKNAYYHIAKGWRGSLRLPIYAKEGNRIDKSRLIDVASGGSRREVMAEAKAIMDELSSLGYTTGFEETGTGNIARRVGKPDIIQVGQITDGELMSKLAHGDPAAIAAKQARLKFHFAPRTPGRMLSGSMPTRVSFGLRPLTEKEIKDKIFGSLLEHENYMAETMLRRKYLASEIGRMAGLKPGVVTNAPIWRMGADLGAEFPIAGENVSRYISDLAGRPTDDGLSKVVDRVMMDTVGIPAASITRAVNDAMFNLTLLWGDVIFPAMNTASIIQTLMPEISYVGRAPINDLMMDYSTSLIKGRVIGAYQHFDPLKFAMRSVRRIIKPDANDRKALSWAVDHSVVAPRLVEEFVGETSAKAGLSSLRKGDVGFLEWFKNANRYLAVRSEEFARLNGFMSGLQAAEKYFGLEGEKAYLFAKLLTERTMFNYGAADRPALITGHVGTTFGLFKNWTMHYLANLWGYSKQGFQHKDFVPLLWAMGGTGALGGAAAAPGYFALDSFSKLVSDKDAMSAMYEAYGDDSGQNRLLDLAFYGIPGMLGLNLGQRATAPGSDPLRDVNSLTSLALLDRVSTLMEFGQSAADQFLTAGQLPGQSQRTFDLFMRAAAPRTIYRFHQVAGDNSIRSLRTGNLLVDNLDYLDRLAFTLGAPTTVLQKALDVDSELWRRQDVLKSKTQALGEAYSEAMLNAPRDLDARAILIQRAYAEQVSPDSMIRSAVARYNNSRVETVERQFKEYQTRKLKQITRGEINP